MRPSSEFKVNPVKKAGPVGGSKSRLVSFWPTALVWSALAASLLVIAYQNVVVYPRFKTEIAELKTPEILPQVSLVGGNSRGGQIPGATVGSGKPFLLLLDIPAEDRFSSYTCLLYSPSGSLAWRVEVSPQQAKDTVSIRVPSAGQGAGEYTLTVQGNMAGSAVDLAPLSLYLKQSKLKICLTRCTMASNVNKVHYFHAEANSLGGFIEQPIKKVIPAQASASLPAVGGHVTNSTEALNFEGIVSCSAAYTRVSGRHLETDGTPSTLVTSVVEGFNLLEIVTADRIVAQVSIEHPADGGDPVFTFTGSRFEGLKIGGQDASLTLNSSLLDSGAGTGPITWSLFQKTGRLQAAKLVKSAQSGGAAYQWVVDRYGWIAPQKLPQKLPDPFYVRWWMVWPRRSLASLSATSWIFPVLERSSSGKSWPSRHRFTSP